MNAKKIQPRRQRPKIRPKKRQPGAWPDLGLLTAQGPLVYPGNLFEAREALKREPFRYESFEALVADGWRVD